MKILIIEDEVKTIDYLKRGLTEQGYSVDAATDGLDGLHLASTGDYDAIILDIMLPGLDGISLLKSLRPSNNTPVIMLTAKDAVASRLEGFQAGADDYLVKPFSFLELLARLQVITKRVRTKEQTNIYIGPPCDTRFPQAGADRQGIFAVGSAGTAAIADRFQNRHHRTGMGHLF